MILFTRFPHRHLFSLSPEYIYTDLPRYFPSYVLSFRPPYVLSRKADPVEKAKRLAELLGEELIFSSRDLSSGVLYAEGLRIEYEYDGSALRRKSISYSRSEEAYAIENGKIIKRPLSTLLIEYPVIIIKRASRLGYSINKRLGEPLPGVLYRKGDPIGVRLVK